jgi:phosphate transport system substrate-binding protein
VTRPRSLAALAAACLAVALLPAAASAGPIGPRAHAAASTITMSGSTSVHPLAIALAKGYVKKFPGKVKFKIRQGGSDTGINDVARGRVSIGNSSRDYQDGDPGGLQFNKIARDGVCIVTHPDNKLANVSQDQVQSIFSGQIRRWEDVQGASASGPIDLVVRTAASGTQDAFQNIFMGQDLRVAPSASQKSTNGLVQQAVRSDEQAIGYVDFQFTSGTNVAAYKGVACTLRNAKSGQYPGLRNFWFVTRGAPKGALAKFIRWAQRDPTAQHKIVAKSWVPIH